MVKALNIEQWMWCIFLGFTELLWGQVVVTFPKVTIPKKFRFGKEGVSIDKADAGMGRVLWMRSLGRLRNQVSSVMCFVNFHKSQ